MAIRVKANNTTALNLTGSWVGGVVPTLADIAEWNSTVTGAITRLAFPVGKSAWTTGTHPYGYSVSPPALGTSVVDGVTYNVLFVTVSA
jgi:hypothetical protein